MLALVSQAQLVPAIRGTRPMAVSLLPNFDVFAGAKLKARLLSTLVDEAIFIDMVHYFSFGLVELRSQAWTKAEVELRSANRRGRARVCAYISRNS